MTSFEYQFRGGKDYYVILGVSPKATREDIRKAYRQLAKKFHPDVYHDDDGSKFKDINEAWEVLRDSVAREKYDYWREPSLGRKVFTGSSTPEPKPKPPTGGHSYRKARTDSEKTNEYPPSISKIMNISEFIPRWYELTNKISKNQLAAEEIIPLLNYIFYAYDKWITSNIDSNNPKYEFYQLIRKRFPEFLERLLTSEYLLGREVVFGGGNDEISRLIADCCEFAKNYRCPILITRDSKTITIVFGQYKPSMSVFYNRSENRSDKPDVLPDWKRAENHYRPILHTGTNIHQILKSQDALINSLQFLKESSPKDGLHPGLVDAFSIWLINNNLPELTPEIYGLVLIELGTIKLDINNVVKKIPNSTVNVYLADQLNVLVTEISRRFSILSTIISGSPSISLEIKKYLSQIGYISLIEKAYVESLKKEFSEYLVLFDPKTDLNTLDEVFDQLNAAEIPVRFTSEESSKGWNKIKYIFSTLRNPVVPASDVSLKSTFSLCRSLPEFPPLRQLYLFHYLCQSSQLNEYVNFVNSRMPIKRGYKKWTQFRKEVTSSELDLPNFDNFCNSRFSILKPA